MNNKNDTSSISFTAHYTGYVWQRFGLSERAFATAQGRLYYYLLLPFEYLARQVVGSDIKTTLLQRHALIDRALEAAIADRPDMQILEIACGLSPRGHRFTRRHPGIRYVEADLPGMAARKRSLLAALDSLDERHRLTICNILERGGESALEQVIAREFETTRPLIVLTEGLVNYFDLPTISAVWRRIAGALRGFPQGAYFSDCYPEVDGHRAAAIIRSANQSLRLASRSRFTLHFGSDAEMAAYFRSLGFSRVIVQNPDHETGLPQASGGAIVRVVLAWV